MPLIGEAWDFEMILNSPPLMAVFTNDFCLVSVFHVLVLLNCVKTWILIESIVIDLDIC